MAVEEILNIVFILSVSNKKQTPSKNKKTKPRTYRPCLDQCLYFSASYPILKFFKTDEFY